MFGLSGIFGGGGMPSFQQSSATGDFEGGDSDFGGVTIGGFGGFAVGSGAKAAGSETTGGGGSGGNSGVLIGVAVVAVVIAAGGAYMIAKKGK